MPYDVSNFVSHRNWGLLSCNATIHTIKEVQDSRFPCIPDFHSQNERGSEYVVYSWGTRVSKPMTPEDRHRRLDGFSRKLHDAYKYARYSIDPSTQNGAVLLSPDDFSVMCAGYTQPTENQQVGVDMLNNREEKYQHLVHAERSCIYNAVRNKLPLEGSVLVVPWFSCPNCAWAIIECGVGFVWGHYDMSVAGQKNKSQDRIEWSEGIEKSYEMFRSAGVGFGHYIGKIVDTFTKEEQNLLDPINIRVSGEEFIP